MKEKKGEGCVSCHVVLTPSDLPIPIFQIQIINLCLFLLGIDGEPHTMQVSEYTRGWSLHSRNSLQWDHLILLCPKSSPIGKNNLS